MSELKRQEEEFSLKQYFVPLTTVKAVHFIIIIGIIVFINMLFNPFVLEDKGLITRNPSVHSIANLADLFIKQIGGQETITYYRPLLFSFYTIIYSVFRENTFPYHVIQLLFHIANSILIFLIFKKFIKLKIAFFWALVFLIHPINEETVAWITNLQEVLYLFFGLLAIYLLQLKKDSNKYILFANISLFLSILSKETGILFIAFGLLYVFFFKKSKLFLHSSLSFIVGLIYLILRIVSQTSLQKEALVPIMKLTFIERMINVPAIIFYYLKTFFYPKDLVIYHSWTIRNIQFDNFFFPLVVDCLFFITLAFMCFYMIKKNKEKKLIIFFLSWFIAGLLFHLQFYALDFTVADHFFNFSLIGLLAVSGIFFQQIKSYKLNNSVFLIITILILSVLSLRTMIRNSNFQDQYSLLTHDTRIANNDYLLEMVYATELIQDNRNDEAISHIQKALTLYPESTRAWNTLGVIYYNKKNISRARETFLKSISLGDYFGSYENYGQLVKERDKPAVALTFLRKASALFPNSQKLWYDRFIVAYKLGNYDEAFLAAKYYYSLKGDNESYAIYTHLLNKIPIKIE